MSSRGKKPQVERNGMVYSCKRYDIEIPDFSTMSDIAISVWMLQNTHPRGHSIKSKVNVAGYLDGGKLA